MTELRLGVLLPKALVKKPSPAGHNNNDGEKRNPTSVDRKNKAMQSLSNSPHTENAATNLPVSAAPAPSEVREPVLVDIPTTHAQQVVSLQELITSGIAIKVDAPKKTVIDHSIDAGKGALAVAGGIGVAAGCYALGKWIAGFFGEDTAE